MASSSFSDHYLQLFFSLMAFALSVLIFFLIQKRISKKRLNLPPGPRGWPVVGNLFQVARTGKHFFEYIEDFRLIYGPIFTLQLGSRTMIILSGADLIHEALIKRGPAFASRPAENPTRIVFSCNKFSVNAAVYGSLWRSLRRNMVENMLSSSSLKEFRDVRKNAIDNLVERIRADAAANGGAVWVLKNARFAVFCILLAMCFGLEMDEESVEKMDQVLKTVLITVDPRIDDFLPILRPFFSKQRKRAMEVRKEQIEFVVQFINRRKKALQNPGSDINATSFSYLDTLFDLKVDGRESSPTDAELVTLCSEFLNGGTDTTAAAIEWGIAELITNPNIQNKLHEEIKQTVGERKVEESDVEKLPYLQAVVKELLRKHPPTYFTLTHSVTEATKLGGYDIPVEANVEVYLAGISKDPEVWKNPEKFEPERFTSGEDDADMTGVKGVKMIPFGVGRRICPGLGMATIHVHVMLARLVQEFEWSSYPPKSKIDFTNKYEFTVVLKNSLRAIATNRA
ncbi:cytochrome P450 77A3-like [Cucurbita pepo subsp. pepo]|uniref:cytochrome P450 77A3-like n=1 Tax=Cucurbita pepo subsp. pepo TaxID=3664 RepID=UPI000C9D6D10|nr:cytochrome P450 77A3-like [Cucurbita pepo subsp. pepo]